MKKTEKKLQESKNFIILTLATCIAFCLIVFSEYTSEGVKKSIDLCMKIIIPSIFPFLLLSSFISELPENNFTKGLFGNITERIFKLPCCYSSGFILSFFGGYPVGLKIAEKLYLKSNLTKQDIKLIASFCFNSGPAFIITAVGQKMFGEIKIGLLIFITCSAASVITGFTYSRLYRKKSRIQTEQTVVNRDFSVSANLIKSVNESSRIIVNMCLWICVFSVFEAIFTSLFPSAANYIGIFAEVTQGCRLCAEKGDVALCCAVCSFGGLCTHLQIYPILKNIEIKYRHFFKYRLINSALSFILCKTAINLNIIKISAIAVKSDVFYFSMTKTEIVMIILVIIFLIIDMPKNGNTGHQKKQ